MSETYTIRKQLFISTKSDRYLKEKLRQYPDYEIVKTRQWSDGSSTYTLEQIRRTFRVA